MFKKNVIKNIEADCVVFSDFRHGIFNKATIPSLCAAIPEGVFKVADSQVASRWGNICEFQGFDLITPNEREARFAMADQDSHPTPKRSALGSIRHRPEQRQRRQHQRVGSLRSCLKIRHIGIGHAASGAER